MKLIIWFFVLTVIAHAQLSGTVIVFQLDTSGFFIAADSRAIFANGAPPVDNHCKIAALKHNVVFGVSGATMYPPDPSDPVRPWGAIDEARIAVSAASDTTDIQIAIKAIADTWATNMKNNWDMVNKIHPERVRAVAKYGHGILTNGFFAIGRNGSLALAARRIMTTDGIITSEIVGLLCPIGYPCASGQTDIFSEFMARKTARAMGPEGDLPAPVALKVIRLVDLTIAYDTTGYVHGPIDALQLSPDGRTTWLQRKPNCPEQSN